MNGVINTLLYMVEERISKCEDMMIKTFQTEKKREKKKETEQLFPRKFDT